MKGLGQFQLNCSLFAFSVIPLMIFDILYLDQHILIGANEGLYTLNLNEIHEASLELVRPFTVTSGSTFSFKFK